MRNTLLPALGFLLCLPSPGATPALKGTGRLPEDTCLSRCPDPAAVACLEGRALLKACTPRKTCPPLEADGKARVMSCEYKSGFSTAYRCILLCTYSNNKTWGTQVDSSLCN